MWSPGYATEDTLAEYESFHRASDLLLADRRDEIEPHEVDELADEFVRVLERYSTPESSVPDAEREMSPKLCTCIMAVAFESLLHGSAPILAETLGGKEYLQEDDRAAGTFSRLFRKTVTTPANLERLFRMTDATVRTGNPRLFAFYFLKNLSSDASVWKITMEDGSPFSMRLIRAAAKGLHDHATMDPDQNALGHMSFDMNFRTIWSLLSNAVVASCDKSLAVVENISAVDWVAIFRDDEESSRSSWSPAKIPLGLFFHLHSTALRALADNPGNAEAKGFIQKLGSCHSVLHRVLEDIVAEGISSDDEKLKLSVHILNCFPCSLAAAPSDRKTDKLVKKAYTILSRIKRRPAPSEAQAQGLLRNSEHDQYDVALSWYSPTGWKLQKKQSDEDRWKRFCKDHISQPKDEHEIAMRRVLGKAKKEARKDMKGTFSTLDVCANCYVSEKDLLEQHGKTFHRCSRCKQISYCSKECQVAHWHSAHKKQCKKKEVGGKST